ncbi:hypothetical protein B566_EDAN007604 [Ephemera danica]|nr:hypothetical protein B566_EDAN007604 [Ephemera danica]
MAALKVCLILALVAAAAYAVPLTNEAAPAAETTKEDGRDISDIIEAAVTGEEDKLGLLPRVALKLVEAGARGKLKLKKLLPFLAIIPLLKLLLLPIAVLFLKGLTLKALFVAKVALILALINAGRSFLTKGSSLFGGLGGSGGAEHYTSYDAGHGGGHDSYSGSSGGVHHGYSRSLIDEAEAKVNSMIEAAQKFFEGDEEPAKTQ